MRPPIALLAACSIAVPVHAQTNVERIANVHYTRSHDYDLIHQRIEVSSFDWDSTSFDGRVTTTLVAVGFRPVVTGPSTDQDRARCQPPGPKRHCRRPGHILPEASAASKGSQGLTR